jgi:hypothetical protein
VPQGYGPQQGYGAPHGHGPPQVFGPPQGYGLPQGYGAPQAWPMVPQAHRGPPEPEAQIRFPGPVGPHWPVHPEVLQGLPTRWVAPHSSAGGAQVMLSIESSVPHVLHEAAALYAQDKEAEAKKKRANTIALVCLILGILTVWLMGLGVVFLVIAAVAYFRGTKHAKLDLEDRRLEVVTGTLWTFATELKTNRAVKVIADFAGYEDQPLIHQHATGTGLFEQLRELFVWQHRWLLLRMTLDDGVAVLVEATTKVKRKTAQKRKYKKQKDAIVEQLTIRLTPPKGKAFPGQQQLPARALPGLAMKRAVIQPRHATFVYQTIAARRVRGRGGWAAYGLEALLDSGKVIGALIHSYKAAARVRKRTAG